MQINRGFIQILGPIIALLIIAGGGYVWYQKNMAPAVTVPIVNVEPTSPISATSTSVKPAEPVKPIACTAEARLCPDGSSVGRTGSNCEFAVCPKIPN